MTVDDRVDDLELENPNINSRTSGTHERFSWIYEVLERQERLVGSLDLMAYRAIASC